jgi:hypothetical protein
LPAALKSTSTTAPMTWTIFPLVLIERWWVSRD